MENIRSKSSPDYRPRPAKWRLGYVSLRWLPSSLPMRYATGRGHQNKAVLSHSRRPGVYIVALLAIIAIIVPVLSLTGGSLGVSDWEKETSPGKVELFITPAPEVADKEFILIINFMPVDITLQNIGQNGVEYNSYIIPPASSEFYWLVFNTNNQTYSIEVTYEKFDNTTNTTSTELLLQVSKHKGGVPRTLPDASTTEPSMIPPQAPEPEPDPEPFKQINTQADYLKVFNDISWYAYIFAMILMMPFYAGGYAVKKYTRFPIPDDIFSWFLYIIIIIEVLFTLAGKPIIPVPTSYRALFMFVILGYWFGFAGFKLDEASFCTGWDKTRRVVWLEPKTTYEDKKTGELCIQEHSNKKLLQRIFFPTTSDRLTTDGDTQKGYWTFTRYRRSGPFIVKSRWHSFIIRPLKPEEEIVKRYKKTYKFLKFFNWTTYQDVWELKLAVGSKLEPPMWATYSDILERMNHEMEEKNKKHFAYKASAIFEAGEKMMTLLDFATEQSPHTAWTLDEEMKPDNEFMTNIRKPIRVKPKVKLIDLDTDPEMERPKRTEDDIRKALKEIERDNRAKPVSKDK